MTNFLSHPLLSIKYDALCIRLAALIALRPASDTLQMHLALIDKTLDDAIKLNQELLDIYTKSGVHLMSQQNTLRTQRSRLLFFKNTPQTPAEIPLESTHLPNATKKFRTETGLWNQLRQFLARSWRFFLNIPTVLVAAGQNAEGFIKGLESAAQGIRPIMNYLSFLFLLPRLLLNLFEFGKHLIRPKGLKRSDVFKLELQERWFELANDMVWVPAGVLGCFLLVGSLSYAGVVLTVALFVWDLLMAGIRAGFELNRLHKTINEEKVKLNNPDLSPDQRNEQQNYIKTLNAYQSYERKRHLISVSNAVIVTIGTILALSLFAVAPWVALLGSCLLMTASIGAYVLGTHVIKRPVNPLMNIRPDALNALRPPPPAPKIRVSHPTPPPHTPSVLEFSGLTNMPKSASEESYGLSTAPSPYSAIPTPLSARAS